jgi:uncharacterized protein YdeI (YjbR/CyaY-like superfamily)
MGSDDVERIYATDRAEFRAWLTGNHATAEAVWLVFYKKDSEKPSVSWSDAVDEALCFGWIDSKVKSLDDERYEQYFTRRKPQSVWSMINKDKVEQLMADGRMATAGMRAVEVAKANGSWSLLDGPHALLVPDDLAATLAADPAAARGYEALSDSAKRGILEWIALAKRPETRARRIAKAASETAAGRSPLG